jgi:hypothetical protein
VWKKTTAERQRNNKKSLFYYLTCASKPAHISLLTAVSATSSPPFRPLRHQRNICHPVLNRFTRQTLPTVNRKHFFMNILCIGSFAHRKRTTERCSSVAYSWSMVTILTTETSLCALLMCVCYLDCHEEGLCCYLVIDIGNLLRSLQLFYFHLWPIYWLSLVDKL